MHYSGRQSWDVNRALRRLYTRAPAPHASALWNRARDSSFEQVLRSGLEDHSLPAFDVSAQPLYYVSMCRKLGAFWFPEPSLSNRKLAERVLLDSIQKGPPDIPAWVHAPIETFLVSLLCKTPITPNKLTLFCNVVAWTVN